MRLILILAVFLFSLFQSDSLLSPTMVAAITALFTIVIGALGAVWLSDKINGNSRIKGLFAGLLAAYGIVVPFISNFPRWIGIAVAIAGLIITLTSARIQGATDRKTDS